MALKGFQVQPASRAAEREPKEPALPADYLRWISFEGSLATPPGAKPKLPDGPEAQRERALQAHLKSSQGSQ